MKTPGSMKPGKGSKERAQGPVQGSGINKPVKRAKVTSKAVKAKYSEPTQKQKM